MEDRDTILRSCEELGGLGLFDRMSSLSVSYQSARPEIEAADLTRLILRAIVFCISPGTPEPFCMGDLTAAGRREWSITTTEITTKKHQLIETEELDFDIEATNSRRIGRAVGKLRIPKNSNGKNRGWDIQAANLDKHLKSYSLPANDPGVGPTPEASSDVSDVTYLTDVNKKVTNVQTSCRPGELDCESSDIPGLNVSDVNNVNNVKTVEVEIAGQTNGRPYGKCTCRMIAFVGKNCPQCGSMVIGKQVATE